LLSVPEKPPPDAGIFFPISTCLPSEIQETQPLSVTRAEDVQAIRGWAKMPAAAAGWRNALNETT